MIELVFPRYSPRVSLWITLWTRGPRGLQLSGLLWISSRTARKRPARVSIDTDTTHSSPCYPQPAPWRKASTRMPSGSFPHPSARAHHPRPAVRDGLPRIRPQDTCRLCSEAKSLITERQASAAALPSVSVARAATSPLTSRLGVRYAHPYSRREEVWWARVLSLFGIV